MTDLTKGNIGRRWFTRPDGARIYVRRIVGRDPNALPILILDGIGCSGWAFRRIAPAIARDRTLLFLHYRGHGHSPTPPRPWHIGIHDLADDAEAACRLLGANQVVVVGFSMGFQVALEFFRRHRHRVAGLISLAGPASQVLANIHGTDLFGMGVPFLAASTRIGRSLSARLWHGFMPSKIPIELGLRTQVNAERIDPQDFEVYMRNLAKVNPELFLTLLDHAHRHSATDVLTTIDVPSLVVAGARDAFIPLHVLRRMAFSIPQAAWHVLTEATHALPAEFPNEVSKLLLHHARRCEL